MAKVSEAVKIADSLLKQGLLVTNPDMDKVRGVIDQDLPPKVYSIAVWGLVVVAVVLTGGGIWLASKGLMVPELWTALGAAIGGLAAIFAASK